MQDELLLRGGGLAKYLELFGGWDTSSLHWDGPADGRAGRGRRRTPELEGVLEEALLLLQGAAILVAVVVAVAVVIGIHLASARWWSHLREVEVVAFERAQCCAML